MKLARILILTAGVALAISGAVPLLERIFADTQTCRAAQCEECPAARG